MKVLVQDGVVIEVAKSVTKVKLDPEPICSEVKIVDEPDGTKTIISYREDGTQKPITVIEKDMKFEVIDVTLDQGLIPGQQYEIKDGKLVEKK